jgi:hypothetical protein
LEPWETTGTGAVALREEVTYGKIHVFCALFPAGICLRACPGSVTFALSNLAKPRGLPPSTS